HAEGLEERAGNILQGEGNRSFVGAAPDLLRLADQQETSVVLPVIFDARQQHSPSVLPCGPFGSDGCGVLQVLCHDVPHASGRVVERDRLYSGVSPKEVAALVEGNRVRVNASHVLERYSGSGNQVVNDAKWELGMDEEVACEQQVEVFGHGACKRVLDRNNC